jgi:hypothetical protein
VAITSSIAFLTIFSNSGSFAFSGNRLLCRVMLEQLSILGSRSIWLRFRSPPLMSPEAIAGLEHGTSDTRY